MKGRTASTGLRVFCGSLLALSLLAFPACSYMTSFVVVNDSGSPVEVRYSFKRWNERGECCPERPARKALDKLDDGDVQWRELRAEEFLFEPATGMVTVTLLPSEVLRVERQHNWRGHGDRDDDESFNIRSVRITGTSGVVSYEGRQAQYQFQWQNDSLYKLTYYGWGDKAYDGRR